MSAKVGSGASIALGIALIAFSGGNPGAIISGALLIAGGAIGLFASPKGSSQGQQRAQDFQAATAASGVPLPVIFGEQRVVGNFMNYDANHFRSVRVAGRSAGKGGDAPPTSTIGFDYFLSFEYGLCMGPIDEIVQVFGTPGERKMMGSNPAAVLYGPPDDFKELTLDSLDPQTAGGSESGLARVYRGNATQVRVPAADPYQFGTVLSAGHLRRGYLYRIELRTSVNFIPFGASSNAVGTIFVSNNTTTDILSQFDKVTEFTGMNYRNICWAVFCDFKIGRFPQPKSYHFVLRRFPVHDLDYHMLRPNGTPIVGFKVRGSADPTKPGYFMANPAAILYEALTNDVWGAGLDPAIVDEPSWTYVSQYFYARNIGMSLTLDTPDKVSAVMDGIRLHVKTVALWDGEFLKLRCLLDLPTTHGHIQTLTRADLKELTVTRPLWHSTVNEVRAEFVNRRKNFRTDAVHVRAPGNWAMVGRITTSRIQLSAFGDFNTARRQAFRILSEKSYPMAAFEFEVNRFHSQLEVGDVFRLLWDEYDTDSTVFAMVTKVEDSDSDQDSIKITALEDQVLIGVPGHEFPPTIPIEHPWERIPDLPDDDVTLWNGEPPTPGSTPAMVMEVPALYRRYLPSPIGHVWIFGEKPAPYFSSLHLLWAVASTYHDEFQISEFASAATAQADFLSVEPWDRSATGLLFSLFNADDEAGILSAFSLVDKESEDLETIIDDLGPFLVTAEELIQVGKVTKVSSNLYRARNIVRGRFGSYVRPISIGQRIFFVQRLPAAFAAAGSAISTNQIVKWRAFATAGQQTVNLEGGADFFIHHTQIKYPGAIDDVGVPDDTRFRRLTNSPLAPEFRSLTDAGSTWTVQVRIRFFDRGAETGPSLGLFQFLTQAGDAAQISSWQIRTRDPTVNLPDGAGFTYAFGALGVAGAFTPGDDDNPDSGVLTITGIPKSRAFTNFTGIWKQIRIIPLENNLESVDDCVIYVP